MPDQIEFQDPTGTINPLTNLNTMVPAGLMGRFMPSYTIYEDVVPGLPGTVGRYVSTAYREVTVPVLLVATSETNLRTRIRALSSFMDPTLPSSPGGLPGIGILRCTAPDGSRRQINCIYKSGHEGVETQGRTGLLYYYTAVVFHAYDPYWYDTQDSTLTISSGVGAATFFSSPFLPLHIGASQVFTSGVVNNSGDTTAWPIWVITGPGNNPTLTNNTTGQVLQVNVSLTAGQVLTIDTRPGQKTVTISGTSYYSSLTAASVFWQLAKGVNQFTLSMASTTSASSLALNWRNRYNSA